jgi:hypothetical protein
MDWAFYSILPFDPGRSATFGPVFTGWGPPHIPNQAAITLPRGGKGVPEGHCKQVYGALRGKTGAP